MNRLKNKVRLKKVLPKIRVTNGACMDLNRVRIVIISIVFRLMAKALF